MFNISAKIYPFLITQVFVSAGVALNLTVAALATATVTGRDSMGRLAQTSIIIGATIITTLSTLVTRTHGRLISLRLALGLAVLGSLLCSMAVSSTGALRWIIFVGLFLLGGGTVSALLSRFAAADSIKNPTDASTAISMVLFGSAIGSAVGPHLYSVAARMSDNPMHAVFLCSAAVFSLGLVPLFTRKSSTTGIPLRKTNRHKGLSPWAPTYTAIFCIGVFSHASMISLMAMAPIYSDKAFGVRGTSLTMTAHLLGMYALGPVVSAAIKKVRFRPLICLGAAIFLLSYSALILRPDSLTIFVTSLFGIGLAWSIGMISASTLASTVPDEHVRITLQGRLDMSINIAAGISSVISGVIVARWGYPTLAAVNGGALLILLLSRLLTRSSSGARASS
ncbi:MFS transporter [Corynebacterium mastitidis]|uniref:MFS transporter n=1 Tax=Corynebacterium mastitidis TaxID=161890 RepID=UPI00254F8EB0|nr:MFS transporter [Corynebacterium mastitidis]MDK8450055.1 MFS transporter [Corynebacterium mastitidis]